MSDREKPVCLDIENITINRPYQKLSASVFSEKENQFVLQAGQLGFYKLWSAKEAIAKCRGKGLSDALKIDLGSQLSNPCVDALLVVEDKGMKYSIFQRIIEGEILLTLAQRSIGSILSDIDRNLIWEKW